MNEENKNRLAFGLKVLLLVLYVLLTIVTCVGVWNYNQEQFVKTCAVALSVCNLGLAVLYYKKIDKDYKKKTRQN